MRFRVIAFLLVFDVMVVGAEILLLSLDTLSTLAKVVATVIWLPIFGMLAVGTLQFVSRSKTRE